MINYRADVWINQIWCGVTEGNYLRLKMDVEHTLKYGSDNIITIRMRSIPNSTAAIPDPLFTKGRYDTSLMEITERFQGSENIELTIQTDGWNVKKQSKNRIVNISN